MNAKGRRRTIATMGVTLAAGTLATLPAFAQQGKAARPAAPNAAQAQADPGRASTLDKLNTPQPTLKPVAVPVNPTDAVAKINGEEVSRQQLANECVVRKGKEILDTLIARKLIEQAIKAKGLEVTAAEIDAEIDREAESLAHVGREAWLRSLDKERGISPIQYARDIIYPTLALRKLAASQVQVTKQDVQDAFEAHFGPKLRCRIIMVDKLRTAQEIWEELKKNPGGFEKIAQERSIDMTSRSLGGLIGEPISRHSYPRTVSDAAFQQLVDGDPKDTDPKHKPKDGDFTGPIQVNETSWVVIRRENVIAGQNVSAEDPKVKEMLHKLMYDAKLKSKMSEVYQDLFRKAAIENVLTGETKLANEDLHPEHKVDGDVKLMSDPSSVAPPAPGAPTGSRDVNAAAAASLKNPPAGVPAEAANRVNSLKRPLKPKTQK